jgi:ribonuclease P protein component
MDQTFGKKYKLCRQKLIDSVFKSGNTVKQYPFVVHFMEIEEKLEAPFQITVSAPKRLFKKAHDRNRIKRLMRETIRKNKLILETFSITNNKQLVLFMVYTSKEEMKYDVLLKKTEQLFKQLVNKFENNDTTKILQ